MEFNNNIWKLYFIHFFRQFHFFGAISVPFFLEWLRVDYTKMFILQSWFVFWVFVLEVPTGVIADKYSRKLSIVLSAVFLSSSFFMWGFITNYYFLFLAEFLAAIGFTLLSGADKALLYDSLSDENKIDSKIFFSRYESAGTIGIIIAFPVGSIIAGSSLFPYPKGLPFTFIMTGFSVLIMLFIALSL
ncbi:MAG: hypothetical protein KKF89_03835, partial [Nanoarchaeota archaeon]|nr:hypothetical protein [Nanoarchaeota archaeon]